MGEINIRQLALESLIEIIENEQFSNQVEKSVLDKYAYLEKRDRAFYTRIVEGTLGSLYGLDYFINQVSKTPTKKMKPLIRNLMRMSLYQILYMDSVPDSAAINEAVKLAKKRGFSQLSGFVNGVLRNLSRQKADLTLPEADLSIRYSMPEWIVESFEHDYGRQKTEEILENLNAPQKLTVRVNTLQTSVEGLTDKLNKDLIKTEAIEGISCGLTLENVDRLADLKTFQRGDFYIQDASSMLVAEAARVKEGDYCLDVCAAPGGKATHLATLLKGTGRVDARDLTDYKVSLIEENKSRLGLTNLTAKVWDARIEDPAVVDRADIVICDAPCSGLGVMGKKKDIRYHATAQGIEELSALQREILSTVQSYVKEGGCLMYSTCTMCKKENEENVEWFLKNYPEFELEFMRQVFPHEVGNDGFFLAKLIRSPHGKA